MFYLPKLRRIRQRTALQTYGQAYEACSGLSVPEDYLFAKNNYCFGLFFRGNLIGGFILGNGPTFRTIEVFAQPEEQSNVQSLLHDQQDATEICCFFIERQYRTRTWLNFATWIGMMYALVRFSNKEILFGTCSTPLARLYAQTRWSVPIHTDRVNDKNTYIFRAERQHAIGGLLKIMKYKLGRVRKIVRRKSSLIHA